MTATDIPGSGQGTRVSRARRGPDPLLVAGLVLVGAVATMAAAAPLLTGSDGLERVAAPYAEPGPGLALGSDDLGRDLYAQFVWGARSSVIVALAVAGVSTLIAAVVGGVAALRGGWVDAVLMRLTDVVLTLPFLPVVVIAAAFLGRSTAERVAVIAVLVWAGPARIVRSGALTVLRRPHAEVAVTLGAPVLWVLARHASVVAAPLLVPVFVRTAAGAVGLDAALAFLGLGDPTGISWGTTLYWAQVRGAFLGDEWLWWALPPGLGIAVLVLGLALIGLGVERRTNPLAGRA